MKKFEVHYEIVFEKYDNAAQVSMEVKPTEEGKGADKPAEEINAINKD